MTIVDIENHLGLIEVIRGVLPSELERYTREYISDNKYIKSSSVAYSYLKTYFNPYLLNMNKFENKKLVRSLTRKLGRTLSKLESEILIERFNTKTFKRVEITPSTKTTLVFIDGSFKNLKLY